MIQSIQNQILTVNQLLGLQNVVIPTYQRPYKWTLKNVADLFHDIRTQQEKSAYRLGTIVFHEHQQDNKEQLDIVDGQQRTLTLMLVVKALCEARLKKLDRKDLKDQLEVLSTSINAFMAGQKFSNEISKNNLRENYKEIKRQVSSSGFTESNIDFLLNRCEVVVFKLHDISEAFQFFDSQNARGRDLEPHDLLKAFHLREFAEHEQSLKAKTVAHWEALPSDDLAKLFAVYLYRIRQWAQGKSARHFSKDQINEFKGVNLDKVEHFPYIDSLRITHHFVDDYNAQYQRKIDARVMSFPFCIDQKVINGRRFFEMAEHYQQQVSSIVNSGLDQGEKQVAVVIEGEKLSAYANTIICELNRYKKRTRIGDRYVRSIFDCAVIFYMDKFGTDHLSSVIERLFIWAYTCRIEQQVVQIATVDNYVQKHNIFQVIKEATLPSDVLKYPLRTIEASDIKNNPRTEKPEDDALVSVFEMMGYYE